MGLANIDLVFSAQHFNSSTRPKNQAGLARLGYIGSGHIGPGQIWPDFFQANNLMGQSDPNFGRIGLAHRARPILPPLNPAQVVKKPGQT